MTFVLCGASHVRRTSAAFNPRDAEAQRKNKMVDIVFMEWELASHGGECGDFGGIKSAVVNPDVVEVIER